MTTFIGQPTVYVSVDILNVRVYNTESINNSNCGGVMKKPNVVFILADDMGYGDFSYFNNGLSETPSLDTLIKDGVCFTQHYSASPVCNPARAALMTGRYPHRTGSIDTLDMNGLDRLALDEITLADVLKNNGYATGIVGKWHLGAIDQRYHPNRRGFGGWQDYYDWHLYYNEKFVKADGRYLTDVFTEEALGFVRRHKNKPFFLHLTYNAPHFPLQAPAEEINPFLEKGRFTKGVCYIYGMIKRMDAGIGKLLEELKKLGLEENTIVLFTSDNGPQFGGSGDMNINRYNHQFRGCKGNVYEGGIRVPMVIRYPELLERGRIIDEMIHFTDWFPTILDICGIKTTSGLKKLDGKNILPLLKGERLDYGTRFWQWNRLYPVRTSNIAMRDGKWKLLRPPVPETMKFPQKFGEIDREYTYHPEKFTDILHDPLPEFTITGENPPQLFNIEDDPFETEDLASEHPEIVEKMDIETSVWFDEVEAERMSIKE